MAFQPAKLDTIAIIITALATAFIVVLAAIFIVRVPYGWLWAFGIMLIPGICYALSPKQYVFEGSNFIIEKVIGKKIIIPIKEIRGYMVLENLAKLKMTRTFGNGGLFGFYGMFSTAEYGPINCQLTSMKNIVLIKTDNMHYAVSPRQLQGFVQMFGSITSLKIHCLETTSADQSRHARVLILALPIALYVATIIIILLAYHALPDTIAVHFDAYGNPDRWGSKVSYIINGFIPVTILLALTVGVFLFLRRSSHRPAIPILLVIIMSFVQLFTLYLQINTYWLNTHHHHLLPFWHVLFAFMGIMVVLLFVYYRVATKIRR
jgi:hypothetical protein